MELYCGLCMYDEKKKKPEKAITIIRGYAVCEGHEGYVAQGLEFHSITRLIKETG